MMRSGRLCNWPNVYWRATFDASSGLIIGWEDLIPYDGVTGCLGATNASAISHAFSERWAALSSRNVTGFLKMHASSARLSFEIGGSGPEPVPAPAGACDNACTIRYLNDLLGAFELFSAVPTEFCVNGDRVTYAVDLMGYPTHPRTTPADGWNALLRRGVAFATVRPKADVPHSLEILSEELVMERFVPRPSRW